MANERGNSEIARTFTYYGGVARKIQDASYVGNPANPNALRLPSRGQADYITVIPRGEHRAPLGMAIEAKADGGKEYIAFSSINLDQRIWLNDRSIFSWIWLWMGGGRAPNGRSAYLIPWLRWLEAERLAEQHKLRGLAWQVAQQVEHRTLGLTVDGQFFGHALQWADHGHWMIPKVHELWWI